MLNKLLEGEVAMSRGDARLHSLVTSANYKIKLIGEELLAGRLCEVLEIAPRTKNTYLVDGRAWVDAEDYSLVRIEGQPLASPSLWTGRPTIVLEYVKVAGFSMTKTSHASSGSLLFGKSELTIEYSDYAVTGTAK